jgi:hypothetical protein
MKRLSDKIKFEHVEFDFKVKQTPQTDRPHFL